MHVNTLSSSKFQDVCPMIHDETQDPSVCRLEEPGVYSLA